MPLGIEKNSTPRAGIRSFSGAPDPHVADAPAGVSKVVNQRDAWHHVAGRATADEQHMGGSQAEHLFDERYGQPPLIGQRRMLEPLKAGQQRAHTPLATAQQKLRHLVG